MTELTQISGQKEGAALLDFRSIAAPPFSDSPPRRVVSSCRSVEVPVSTGSARNFYISGLTSPRQASLPARPAVGVSRHADHYITLLPGLNTGVSARKVFR